MRYIAPFYIDDTFFGIDVMLVREVNRNLEITPVDRAPRYIAGLQNLRGQIVTILDIGVRLGFDKRELKSGSYCIVLKTSDELDSLTTAEVKRNETSAEMTGFLVDRIGDMVSIDDEEIEPPPANIGDIDGKYITGIVKMENSLLLLLALSSLINLDK